MARALTVRLPSLVGDRVAVRSPAGAVTWRSYLRSYGADGATAIEVLRTDDVTFAGVYGSDVAALADRLGTLEGQIRAGLPLTAPRLPSYPVGSLPAPGNPGRQAWASDGRARQADGTIEAANAGSGVAVEDNGERWVLPGTNQQVQA